MRSRRPLCGASIISSDSVLTAAHCVPESQAPGELMVVAGNQVWDLEETAETRHAVCGVTRHPAYRQRETGTRG